MTKKVEAIEIGDIVEHIKRPGRPIFSQTGVLRAVNEECVKIDDTWYLVSNRAFWKLDA